MRPLRLGLVWACLLLSSMPVLLYGQAGDKPPSAPAGLTAKAYNATSGALLWLRSNDDVGVRGYEVARDGEVLVIADRLSFIDETLQAGKGYNYSVVAIDTAGQRSARAVTRIETPDAPPASPAGLFAHLHSASEVRLGWIRSAAIGERFEVRRDGVTVAQIDGVGFVDGSLVDGRRYLFEVIAVNRQGQRSTSSRVLVDSEAVDIFAPATGDAPPLDDAASPDAGAAYDTTPATDRPATPTGLRASVYSATAAGIGWTRAETPGMRHEVRRDGVVVAITDGTSHVTASLSPRSLYRYTIVAIDTQDARSTAALIEVRTPAGALPVQSHVEPQPDVQPGGQTGSQSDSQSDSRSVLARLGHATARDTTNALVSGVYLDDYLAVDESVARLPPGIKGQPTRLACSGGGFATVTENTSPRLSARAFSFERCVMSDRTLDGNLERTTETMHADARTSVSLRLVFAGLTVRQSAVRSLTLVGSSVRVATETRGPFCADTPDTLFNVVNAISSALWTTSEGTTNVLAANYAERLSDARADPANVADCRQTRSLSFDGTARVRASRFGEDSAALAKRGQIVRDARLEGLAGATGSLSAGFSDGSSFVLTILSDGDSAVQMDIADIGGTRSFEDAFRFEPSLPYKSP